MPSSLASFLKGGSDRSEEVEAHAHLDDNRDADDDGEENIHGQGENASFPKLGVKDATFWRGFVEGYERVVEATESQGL